MLPTLGKLVVLSAVSHPPSPRERPPAPGASLLVGPSQLSFLGPMCVPFRARKVSLDRMPRPRDCRGPLKPSSSRDHRQVPRSALDADVALLESRNLSPTVE